MCIRDRFLHGDNFPNNINPHGTPTEVSYPVEKYIINQKIKSKLLLLAPVDSSSTKTSMTKLDILKKQGFVRIFKNNSVLNIGDLENKEITDFKLVVDRLVVSKNEDFKSRVADSVELSFYEGDGICSVFNLDSKEETSFSNNFEMDEIKFIEPSVHLFSFNNPFGACKNCDGFGETIGIDEELVIPNKGLSVYDDAIAPWRGTGLRKYYMKLIENADLFNFPIYKPYNQLSKDEIKVLWDGNEHYGGINKFFKYLEKKNYKIQNRVLLSRYRGKTLCNECNGSRLRKEAYSVKIEDKKQPDKLSMPNDKIMKTAIRANQIIIEKKFYQEKIKDLKNLPKLIEETLLIDNDVQAIASTFNEAKGSMFLGRGFSYPIALEGALKLKELSYVHAEGYPAGEMKHGPLALIEEGMPVVVLAPRDNYYKKTISNMQEVVARGAKVLLITNKSKDEILSENIWEKIEVETSNDDLLPFLLTIPLQKLAYYSALKKGYDIDKPRNLAKSVTVE